MIEERETTPAERLLPELEHIVANAVGAGADALVQDALHQAKIFDPESATHEQFVQAVGYLAQSLRTLVASDQIPSIVQQLNERVNALQH